MAGRRIVRGEGETRQRILDAAIRLFAKAGYDEVALRDIAAEVGVDVAYVHRSFGSKEKLFRAVLQGAGNVIDVSKIAPSELASTLARALFKRKHASVPQGVDPLLILVRSLTSQKAGRLAGEQMQAGLIGPVRDKLGDSIAFRAAMIISLLTGLSIMRNLLRLPAAIEIGADEAEALVANAIEALALVSVATSEDTA